MYYIPKTQGGIGIIQVPPQVHTVWHPLVLVPACKYPPVGGKGVPCDFAKGLKKNL